MPQGDSALQGRERSGSAKIAGRQPSIRTMVVPRETPGRGRMVDARQLAHHVSKLGGLGFGVTLCRRPGLDRAGRTTL